MPDPTAESAAREPDALADTQVDGRSDASEPSGLRELLRAKAHEWKLRATRKFEAAERMSDAEEPGKRMLQHGAQCYANCAIELTDLLATASIPEGGNDDE